MVIKLKKLKTLILAVLAAALIPALAIADSTCWAGNVPLGNGKSLCSRSPGTFADLPILTMTESGDVKINIPVSGKSLFFQAQGTTFLTMTSSGLVLANNVYLTANNAAGNATINLLKVNATDDTVLNSSAGDPIIFSLEDDAQRLVTLDATSDTAFSLTWGDAGVTAVQILTIQPSTADADDDASLQLGFASGGRGAGITLPGEETAGGSDITYNAGTSDTHIFNVASVNVATLGTSSLLLPTSVINFGAAPTADVTGAIGAPVYSGFSSSTGLGYGFVRGTADTSGSIIALAKSRATDGTADTVVSSGDSIGLLSFYGADGAAFQEAARILVTANAAWGSGDAPGAIDFQVAADGGATLGSALKLANDKSAVFTGTVTSSRTTDLGWTPINPADNIACNTSCTSACVVGVANATGSAVTTFVACSDATADECICAGAS